MEQVETKSHMMGTERQMAADDQALSRAAALATGSHVLADATRLASGDHVLTDAVARMNASGGGSLTAALARYRSASPRNMKDGVEAAVLAAPPGRMQPTAPTSPVPDPKAIEIFHKCADAAERVHGTGRYAAAGQAR